jgi:rhamnulose-1-phosphate aldolase/alcohol dehydrogenase
MASPTLPSLWNNTETAGLADLDEPELLRYRSNLLGSDKRLTNFGGGNTSAKLILTDPLTGENVTVLWVKGSGGDLGTIKRDGFAMLYQDKLDALKNRYRGEQFEDEMVDLYPLCAFNGGGRAPSIDTPLHAFLPFPHVDHLHPDTAIALAASANGPALLELLKTETGIDLVWLPWKRPGFELGLMLERAQHANPTCDGILLGSHGLFTWGMTGESCYAQTLRVLNAIEDFLAPKIAAKGNMLFGGAKIAPLANRQAIATALFPKLRGEINGGRIVGHFDDAPEVLRFVNSHRAEALAHQGTSCPDHFVRTKVRPLLLKSAEDDIAGAMEAYRADYKNYYETCKHPNSPALRAPEPTVVLVPGVGMFAFGKTKAEARLTSEFYTNAIHVMEGATALDGLAPVGNRQDDGEKRAVDNYVALSPQEAFNIEYWLLEEAKLQRMPAEKDLSRRVIVLVGTGSGIGRTIAHQIAKRGAYVVCADIKEDFATETATELQKQYGKDSAIAVTMDCTNRESVKNALNQAVVAYSGIDSLINIAALFFPPDANGRITEDAWRKTLDVNLLGSYVPADEAMEIFKAQRAGGSIVLISSANAVVAKQGSFAYDVSKAALSHLVRELAVQGGNYGVRVNAVAPASVVEGSLQFPKERVMSSLEKYGVEFSESEDVEALRQKLAKFYAKRTLLGRPVTPTMVAEAVVLLLQDNLTGLTTGHILPVDAGLPEAFLR